MYCLSLIHISLKNLIDYHNDNQLMGTIMTCDCDLDKKFGRVIRESDQAVSYTHLY